MLAANQLRQLGSCWSKVASISDASSMQGNTTGVISKELTASERGREGSEAALVLHEELEKLRASLTTTSGELSRTKEELANKAKEHGEASKDTEGMKKELVASNTKLAEAKQKAGEIEGQLKEANV